MSLLKEKGALEEFFASGLEETISPFLTPSSRRWGKNLLLRASIAAACFLLIAFALSFFIPSLPICYICLTFTYFLAGIPALISTVEDLSSFKINIDVLMTLAAFLSILIGSAFEGALLLVLFSFSAALEDAVTNKAKNAISSLKKLSPTMVFLVQEDGSLMERSIHDISIGAKILVKAGELIPLDGKIIHGISSINLVHLTGESTPIIKQVDDEVAAGGRNLEGALTLEVTRTSTDSTLAKIIELITQAQEAKPRFQRWLDKVSDRYAITIILLAFGFALLLPLFSSLPFLGSEGSIYRSLSFLIAASPCALIIAIPIAYLSSISSCAKKGILLKGGLTLDALAKCTTIAFDKTGTLTKGELACENIIACDASDQHKVDLALSYAAALERNVVHPFAKAIQNLHSSKKLPLPLVEAFKSTPGFGLEGMIESKHVFIGNVEFILSKLEPKRQKTVLNAINEIQSKNNQYALALIENSLFIFTFSDLLRPNVAKQIELLKEKCHLKPVMLTGDHHSSAQVIAKAIHIEDFYADLRPDDKLEHIAQLSKTTCVAMVGDGINDAPALARATVGIAMGKVGSTTAIDAADVVLLQDNLENLSWLFAKSKKTVSIVKQNLFIAAAAILVATTPALLGFIPLWLAVILHEGGTVLVGLNALRLLKK